MENQAFQVAKAKSSKGRPEGLKLFLIAGLAVQAWAGIVGLGLIILNFTH